MKDIDFDELDKAVSSLMKGVPQSELETKQRDDDVKEIPSSPASSTEAAKWQPRPRSAPQPNPAPLDESSSVQNEPITQPSTPTKYTSPSPAPAKTSEDSSRSIVPQRKSGRFMDIVPQSSAAKKQPSFARRRSQVISQVDAAPAGSDVISDEAKDTAPSIPTATVSDTSSSLSAWPDPLDLHENTKSASTQDEPQSDTHTAAIASNERSDSPLLSSEDTETRKLDELVASTNQSEISASTEVVSQQKPASTDFSSPFLTDAKVEKRPLGGSGSESSSEQDAPASLDETTHSNSDLASAFEKETTVDTGKLQDPLPEELGSDIVAIESGTAAAQPASPSATTNHSSEKTPAEDDATLPDSATSSGPQVTSITQQYKIKSTDTPAEHAPIYDSHPEPLSHPAKAKSGWLTVLWILGLVLLGAGGAAALYFLNIV